MTALRLTIVVGWALLTCAWVVGNPPLAAPDERDHYVRALGVMAGDLAGSPAPEAAGGKTPRQVAWTRQATRSVRVERSLAPPNDCYVLVPTRSAACLLEATANEADRLTTPVGTYQPLPYLIAAPATSDSGSSLSAVRAARIPGALLSTILLAIAVFAMRSTTSLVGVLTAVTPMVLFSAASVSGSGAEIAAGVAVSATAVRLSIDRAPPTWLWAALGFSAVVLSLSRSPGPVWTLLLLLLPIALVGARACFRKLREGGPTAWLSLTAVVFAMVANRIWEFLYGPTISPVTESPSYGARLAAEQWWHAMPEVVGRFGYLEFDLPLWISLSWLLLLVLLLLSAWKTSSPRSRKVLVGAAIVALLLPLLVFMAITRQTGFGLQGRHVLPFLVALPVLAGALLPDRGKNIARLALAGGAIVASCQLAAFWMNARRSSVGTDGPVWFLQASEWSPPGGWAIALLPAILGSIAIAIAAVLIARDADADLRLTRRTPMRS